MEDQELENKVLTVEEDQEDQNQIPQPNHNGRRDSDELKIRRYVQVKKQVFVIDSATYKVLKIIDISSKIHFNQAKVQQKMLSIANATVSHEMRTPLNSMLVQTDQVDSLTDSLIIMINSEWTNPEELKAKMLETAMKIKEANQIN